VFKAMQTLFLKIFVWFWLAMAVMGIVLMISISTTDSPDHGRPNLMVRPLMMYAHDAAAAFEQGGKPALSAYLASLKKVTHLDPFFFDHQGHELLERTPPPELQELIRHYLRSGERDFIFSEENSWMTHGILTPEGRQFLIAANGPFLGPGRRRPRPWLFPLLGFLGVRDAETHVLVIRLSALLLASGIVCYGLARYLTSPLVRLRAATHQLAGGDLKARFGPLWKGRQDELTDLARDFDWMAAQIEKTVMAQKRLLIDISHELRSPLTRIQVALGLIRQNRGVPLDPELERIDLETKRLDTLIGQVLGLARLESTANGLLRQPIDLSALLKSIAQDADFEAQSQNRAVRIVSTSPVSIHGNEELLRSAIENVVRNAIKYTGEETEVEITLSLENSPAGCRACIRVRDHGEGVPESTLSELFRPFYRVAEARDRQTGGTGLGLAIAEKAVLWHGGTINASNAPTGGLIVEIRLSTNPGK
jgi:signal transduction histidine kinase